MKTDWTDILKTIIICICIISIIFLFTQCTIKEGEIQKDIKQSYTKLERCINSCPVNWVKDKDCVNRCLDIEEKEVLLNDNLFSKGVNGR